MLINLHVELEVDLDGDLEGVVIEDLGEDELDKVKCSIRDAVENALRHFQANGFSHAMEDTVSIMVTSVELEA